MTGLIHGSRLVATIGLIVGIIGMLLLVRLPVHGSYVPDVLPSILLTSLGMGAVFMPLTLIATTGLDDDDDQGLASGLFNTSQQVGGSVGLAILSTVATTRTNAFHGTETAALVRGFHYAFAGAAGLLAIALVVLLRGCASATLRGSWPRQPRRLRPDNRLARHELECRGSRFLARDVVDDAGGVAAVLRAVFGVDFVVDVVRLDEKNVFVDAAGANVSFVSHLCAAEPGRPASVDGADVEVVAVADDPDGHRASQRAVASHGRDLQFFGCADLAELVARPCGHQNSIITLIASRSFIAR
jgi:MFS family permease